MKSRNLATISLAVMACGFLITLLLPDNLAVELLRGGFEAGLVGGIADWFAVTALFRHPLGLKIPHTSLLLQNRNKIVQSLISAMENELLNKASIEKKLRSIRLVELGGQILTKYMARRTARMEVLRQLGDTVRRLPVEKATAYLQKGVADYIRSADLGGPAEQIATRLMQDGKDVAAMDYALGAAAEWSGRPETRAMLGRIASEKLAEVKLGGLKGMAFQAFVGFMDEEMLGEMLQGMLKSGIRDFQNADNPNREQILREIRVAVFRLVNDEEKLGAFQEWAAMRLQEDGATAFLTGQMELLRTKAADWLEEDRQTGGRKLFSLYALLIRRISSEQTWIGAWEEKLRGSLITWVEANHYRLGVLVKENLDQMDDASLVSMLEEKIGKDLQWIRVNGAVCGFAVGLVLSVIQMF